MAATAELQKGRDGSRLGIERLADGYEEFSDFYREMYDEWVRTGDHARFIHLFDQLQRFLVRQQIQYRMRSEQGTVSYYAKYGIVCYTLGSTTEDYALHSWNHENAHKRAASKWKIRTNLRVTWVPNGIKGHFIQPWIEMSVADLRKLAADRQLFSAMHEVLWAPSDVGLGYRSEEAIAIKALDAARLREGYQF